MIFQTSKPNLVRFIILALILIIFAACSDERGFRPKTVKQVAETEDLKKFEDKETDEIDEMGRNTRRPPPPVRVKQADDYMSEAARVYYKELGQEATPEQISAFKKSMTDIREVKKLILGLTLEMDFAADPELGDVQKVSALGQLSLDEENPILTVAGGIDPRRSLSLLISKIGTTNKQIGEFFAYVCKIDACKNKNSIRILVFGKTMRALFALEDNGVTKICSATYCRTYPSYQEAVDALAKKKAAANPPPASSTSTGTSTSTSASTSTNPDRSSSPSTTPAGTASTTSTTPTGTPDATPPSVRTGFRRRTGTLGGYRRATQENNPAGTAAEPSAAASAHIPFGANVATIKRNGVITRTVTLPNGVKHTYKWNVPANTSPTTNVQTNDEAADDYISEAARVYYKDLRLEPPTAEQISAFKGTLTDVSEVKKIVLGLSVEKTFDSETSELTKVSAKGHLSLDGENPTLTLAGELGSVHPLNSLTSKIGTSNKQIGDFYAYVCQLEVCKGKNVVSILVFGTTMRALFLVDENGATKICGGTHCRTYPTFQEAVETVAKQKTAATGTAAATPAATGTAAATPAATGTAAATPAATGTASPAASGAGTQQQDRRSAIVRTRRSTVNLNAIPRGIRDQADLPVTGTQTEAGNN